MVLVGYWVRDGAMVDYDTDMIRIPSQHIVMKSQTGHALMLDFRFSHFSSVDRNLQCSLVTNRIFGFDLHSTAFLVAFLDLGYG